MNDEWEGVDHPNSGTIDHLRFSGESSRITRGGGRTEGCLKG